MKNTKWLELGFLVGIITSLCESFFMLDQSVSVPVDYPFFLSAFNILFWPILFSATAFLFTAFPRMRIALHREGVAPGIALVMFALAYGFFSKTGLLNYFPDVLTHCSDKHVSFVWVICVIVFSQYVRRAKNLPLSFPIAYAPDIALITGLLLFCSNVRSLMEYIAGVVVMFAVYMFMLLQSRFFTRNPPITYAVLFALFFVSTTACYALNSLGDPLRRYAPTGNTHTLPDRPSVILIVLDTLRADRLSLYGGPVPVPHLEQFARDGILFERCIATSSWTPPSHASLFTGLFPSEHGCVAGTDPNHFPVLSGSLKTLAETFQEHGYQTAGIVANFGYLGIGTNFDQGFQIYDSRRGIGSIFTERPARPPANLFFGLTGLRPKYAIPYAVAEDINKNVMRVLDRIGGERFFLFVNYMDPHSPYYPPLPYALSFTPDRLAVWKRAVVSWTMGKNTKYNALWLSQYNGETAYLDTQLAELFKYLKKTGLYDPSLIIVTSDHGEMFGEHGLAEHRCELYQEVVHVPLIIKLPGGKMADRREQKTLTLADVFHNIIALCELSPSDVARDNTASDFEAVAELHDQQFGLQQAFYYQHYKYMTYEKKKFPQLFNLKTDPTEQHNLMQEPPDILKAVEEKIKNWREKHTLKISQEQKSAPRLEEAEDARKRLRSLGYIK